MKTHTPGPWRTTGLNVRAGDALICYATNHWADDETPESERQANADLISSAPELLAALERLLESAEYLKEDSDSAHGYHGEPESFKLARAAIAKAKGLANDE